ncbi:MAG: hypothetical protein ACK5XQ_12055 [Flavobacteriales bacterium]|jgi:hypothetical protein
MRHTAEATEAMEQHTDKVAFQVVRISNEQFFKIANCHLMRPFMMNVVSDSNHWMFLMSNGGLTAGRKNSEYSLFPYYTDDKLAEFADFTGSKTILHVADNDEVKVWEPFSHRFTAKYRISRNLFKNKSGNKVIFEEINHDLDLAFSYEWNMSKVYGFIKKSRLINRSSKKYNVIVLDGIQNIMPHGVSSFLQNSTSNLVDAYKRNELEETSGLGIYSLSAFIVDKAEPSESLKANVAWCLGLTPDLHLLSSIQLERFRQFQPLDPEHDVKGEKGAYFVQSRIVLNAGESRNWEIIANVNLDHAAVAQLIHFIRHTPNPLAQIQKDIDHGTASLNANIAAADGIQVTSDPLKDARHFSNTLFNIMRGGIFDQHYFIDKKDFLSYLKGANDSLLIENRAFNDTLPDNPDKPALDNWLSGCSNLDLIRLTREYLPLRFSRRHGDPSRPWNKFTINTHSEQDGGKILDYEGNWRDIFQNWEALAHSFPEFVEGMIFKFLNASTFDGYNPYRITKDGFDWETIEPDNPWSYIGYWGDHQIIYLLKFLEFADQVNADLWKTLVEKDCFVYANVPYRIKLYEELRRDPKNTIEFDEESDHAIRKKMEEIGSDGALLPSWNSDIHRVNFIEKILATILAKISNFIPEGGIWMNTQRPEWNDANNALVGNGVSVVTLCYLRRFAQFLSRMLADHPGEKVMISAELGQFLDKLEHTLSTYASHVESGFDDNLRKQLTDALGKAGSDYRERIYQHGFSGDKTELALKRMRKFIQTANTCFEHTIRVNVRPNGLYNAYNLLIIEEDAFRIGYLEDMLEGQVAAISSGLLTLEEVNNLLDALRASALYRPDQNSYLLYPNKELPGFMKKNNLPSNVLERSALLAKLVEDGDQSVILKDVNGRCHFNGNFHNAEDLKEALTALDAATYGALAEQEWTLVLNIFEEVFNHKSFTGRSGTFFAYEGLGSIYWHMVSKLYLAVGEVCVQASANGSASAVTNQLLAHFRDIGDGIGVHKSPELYGAFPTDAYSHTPMHRGAQQPGMTGQVKEDILARFGELGIRIQHGKLGFGARMLRRNDFTLQPVAAEFTGVDGEPIVMELEKGMLAFSYCQIPVVYELADKEEIVVQFTSGNTQVFPSLWLNKELSSEVFLRTGTIRSMHVMIPEHTLSA